MRFSANMAPFNLDPQNFYHTDNLFFSIFGRPNIWSKAVIPSGANFIMESMGDLVLSFYCVTLRKKS